MSVKGTAAMQGEIDPALVDKMVALVRTMARAYEDRATARDYLAEGVAARDIAALLPTDPDLLEARALAKEALLRHGASYEAIAAGDIGAGERDDAIIVHAVRDALVRGRQLEREGK